jgi:hypothetical protein
MKTNPQPRSLGGKLLWPSVGAAVLMLWTAYNHIVWSHQSKALHGVVAFFLGLVILLIVNAGARLVMGAWRGGWRWLFSGEALRLCGWTIGFMVSVLSLFYAVELWRGKQAWAGLVREAQLLGEPLGFEALIPPPVPDQQNFAKAALFAPLFEASWSTNAFSPREQKNHQVLLDLPRGPYPNWQAKSWPWLEQERTDLHAWAEYYLDQRLPSGTPESYARSLLQALDKYATNLNQLRDFSVRPYCRFPLPYDRQMLGAPTHLVALRGVIRMLASRASAQLELQELEGALADTQLALRLVDYSRQQPWAAAARVRTHLTVTALQPIWEGLADRKWTAQQLAGLQNQLEALKLSADYLAQLRADALAMTTFVETLMPTTRSSPRLDFQMDADGQRSLNLFHWLHPVGWSLQDQAAIRRFQFEYAAAFAAVKGQTHPSGRRRAHVLFSSSDPLFPVFVIPKVRAMAEDSQESSQFSQTAVNLATLACALERYRLDRGRFPETLAALAPQFLAQLPPDLITGEPLKYRRDSENHFLLYSVGLNHTDEGGEPLHPTTEKPGRFNSLPNLYEADWVWAYSAPQGTP